MTRSRVLRRERAVKAAPPDLNAIHHFRCQRCERLMWTRGIATECHNCINAALSAWQLGPIRGEVSGT